MSKAVLVQYGRSGRKKIIIPHSITESEVCYVKNEFLKMALLDSQVDFAVNNSTKPANLVLKQYDVDFEEEVDIPPDHDC
jgi:uncharacterized membrane protein YfhO